MTVRRPMRKREAVISGKGIIGLASRRRLFGTVPPGRHKVQSDCLLIGAIHIANLHIFQQDGECHASVGQLERKLRNDVAVALMDNR